MRGKQRHGGPYVSEELRDGAVSRLLALREGGDFRSDQVALVAEQLGVAVRTVWGWLKVARTEGRNVRKRRARLEVTEADVIDLAYHRGNVAAFHRARRKEGPTPGIDAWRRAFLRELSPGQRAGLIHGERVRREYDRSAPWRRSPSWSPEWGTGCRSSFPSRRPVAGLGAVAGASPWRWMGRERRGSLVTESCE